MRILVTGGAGFIGSHLCELLAGLGHQVTAVDNLVTGRRSNLGHLVGKDSFTFWEADVTQDAVGEGWEAIFHLASPASPVGYQRKPIETLLVNSLGTYHLLDLASASGAQFLLASSSEVYGDPPPQEHPQRETYWGNVNPVGPRSCYDEGKRFAEAITASYLKERGVDARIVRIFNTYGPRMAEDDGRIIPTFISQALHGEPITVYGDGSQTRSLCYVTNLVDGLVKAMFSPGTRGEVFNLGNPDERRVAEYAHLIRELTGSSSPVIYTPPREEEIARRRPDITKAEARLGWRPTTPLREGLAKTIEWFREASA
ncbi:MAG: SDR family oxidoreductase [Chloroflexi bacterium]|nr:SDR family oxidoreductase [Chloroflexota bacterium]